ncbi:MAG: type II toxin-antitoxin system Phd/YefM family antitoxin [Alphaproteobacteria bacterium]|nr:type II toxin-antitoxin system Phd/YefM family antitoxin [Alphaproteobacteria bacterium]
MNHWQVQEAKARFSELLRHAAKDGPQAITIRGQTAAVVVSQAEYDRLKGRKPSLVKLMQTSPLAGIDLKLERDRSPPRDVDL